MFRKLLVALAMTMGLLTAVSASAGDYGSREEAVAMVERAQALYEGQGIDVLIKEVMNLDNPEFHDRDLYAFVYDPEGTIMAHGVNSALVGRNLMGLRDQNGVFLVKDMIEMAAENGEGWVDYHWPNPTTSVVEAKSSFVRRLDSGYVVGVGVYADQ